MAADQTPTGQDVEKSAVTSSNVSETHSNDEDGKQLQRGVQQVRAITSVWSCTSYRLDMLLTAVQSSLNPYITSSFGRHGLLAAVGIVPTIIAGTSTLTIAKIIDFAGRIEGFVFMLLLSVVGCIVKATAYDIETYIAAHSLYWTGHLGLLYVIDVMLSDMTTLKNRMIALTGSYTPTIATTFAGPKIAELFYANVNFRWAFGAFAIMLTAVCLPVIIIMLWTQRTALKTGVLVRTPSRRTLLQNVVHLYVQMDITGIIIITAAFALFLLPFSLVTYAPSGWTTGYIIAMIVVGFILFPIFYFYEKKLAPVPFLEWRYLQDPTILGSCFLYGVMFASIFAWNSYLNSYLQVVHQLSITNAGYVLNALSLTSAIASPLVAATIRGTGNFKYVAYSGVPIFLLGTALLIPFRTPTTNIGLVAFTQILVGLGSGIFSTCVQLAVMVSVTHQEIAAVLALEGLFGSIGSSIGIAISGGIWTNTLPGKLEEYLPEGSKGLAPTIFASIETQLGYAWGSPEREAIVRAYGDVQRLMAIAGVAMAPLCLVSIWVWKNVNVKRLQEERGKQTAGNVW